MHPDCLLLSMGYSSKCIDLAMYISGGFAKGLVSGAVVCIRLLLPSTALCLDVFSLFMSIGQIK